MVRPLFLSSLLFTLPAAATTLIYKSLDDLVREAGGILIATVKRVETHGEREAIHTLVTLADLNLLHGRHEGNEFTLRLEGGRAGRHGVRLEGNPSFETGERLLLFVQGKGRYSVPLVGWRQGVFRIVEVRQSGEVLITDDLGNRILSVERGQLLKSAEAAAASRSSGTIASKRFMGRQPPPAPVRRWMARRGPTRPSATAA